MRKLTASIAVSVLSLGLSIPALAQGYEEKKSPPDKTKGKAQDAAPATKAMDKASSPEKTGVPESGASTPNTLPATKSMDKASSPDKSGAPKKGK